MPFHLILYCNKLLTNFLCIIHKNSSIYIYAYLCGPGCAYAYVLADSSSMPWWVRGSATWNPQPNNLIPRVQVTWGPDPSSRSLNPKPFPVRESVAGRPLIRRVLESFAREFIGMGFQDCLRWISPRPSLWTISPEPYTIRQCYTLTPETTHPCIIPKVQNPCHL